MAGVASQFIILTDEYQLLPANAINLVIVELSGASTLDCSGNGSDDQQLVTGLVITAGVGNVISVAVLQYVKLTATGKTAKLYYGVS